MSENVQAPESVVEAVLENEGNEVVLHFTEPIRVPVVGRGGPLAKMDEPTEYTQIHATIVEASVQDIDADDVNKKLEAWVDLPNEERERIGYPAATTMDGRPGFNLTAFCEESGEWRRPSGRAHVTIETQTDMSYSTVTIGDVQHVEAVGESTMYDDLGVEEPDRVRINARFLPTQYANVVRRGDSKTLNVGVDRSRNVSSLGALSAWRLPDQGDTVRIKHPSGDTFTGTFIDARLFDAVLNLRFSIGEHVKSDQRE